jgi:hypothetical protein
VVEEARALRVPRGDQANFEILPASNMTAIAAFSAAGQNPWALQS